MGLADKLLAYRRLPSPRDPVAVALWLVGWSIWVWLAYSLAQMGAMGLSASYVTSTLGAREGRLAMAVLALLALYFLLMALAGSWMVSDAYRTWQAGHRHGKQWAVIIALYLLMVGVLPLATGRTTGPPPWSIAMDCLQAALGAILLVSTLATEAPPAPAQAPSP